METEETAEERKRRKNRERQQRFRGRQCPENVEKRRRIEHERILKRIQNESQEQTEERRRLDAESHARRRAYRRNVQREIPTINNVTFDETVTEQHSCGTLNDVSQMVRKYQRHGHLSLDRTKLQEAFIYWSRQNPPVSVRIAALKFDVRPSTLSDAVRRSRNQADGKRYVEPLVGTGQVFPKDLEECMAFHLMRMTRMFFGLTPLQTRILAYEFAVANKDKIKKIPENWIKHKKAGLDWFSAFCRRNKLSLKCPESISMIPVTSLNCDTVNVFYAKLQEVLSCHSFPPNRIFNVDETSIVTPKQSNVVRQHGEYASLDPGQNCEKNVTVAACVSACGHALPLTFIFPRKQYDHRRMMSGTAQYRARGLVHESGRMTRENFLKVVKFIAEETCTTPDNPILLIMDAHESHRSIMVSKFCRENGVYLLILPPHTSNHLQPLDVSVFGPFKEKYGQVVNDWNQTHGSVIGMYDLPALACLAWTLAATNENVSNGFRKTGIYPCDKDVWTNNDILGDNLTDWPNPVEKEPTEERSVVVHPTPCTSVFSTSTLSFLPIDEQTPPPMSPYPSLSCYLCQELFFSEDLLIKHALNHIMEKDLECNFCGKCFPTKYDVLQHNIHHVSVKLHKCAENMKSCNKCVFLRYVLSPGEENRLIYDVHEKRFLSGSNHIQRTQLSKKRLPTDVEYQRVLDKSASLKNKFTASTETNSLTLEFELEFVKLEEPYAEDSLGCVQNSELELIKSEESYSEDSLGSIQNSELELIKCDEPYFEDSLACAQNSDLEFIKSEARYSKDPEPVVCVQNSEYEIVKHEETYFEEPVVCD